MLVDDEIYWCVLGNQAIWKFSGFSGFKPIDGDSIFQIKIQSIVLVDDEIYWCVLGNQAIWKFSGFRGFKPIDGDYIFQKNKALYSLMTKSIGASWETRPYGSSVDSVVSNP